MSKWAEKIEYIADMSCIGEHKQTFSSDNVYIYQDLEDYLEIVFDEIRNDALEEAANIAESWTKYDVPIKSIGPRISRAIRSLKEVDNDK